MDARSRLREYRSILRNAAIEATTLHRSLNIGSAYGRLNHDNQDGYVSDDELETALFDRYKKSIIPECAIRRDRIRESKYTHIVSMTSDIGGHTKLLEKLLQIQTARGDVANVCVSRNTSPVFERRCRDSGVELYVACGTLDNRCREIIRCGYSSNYIFLHIHPDDLCAAVAARFLNDAGKRVYFVNHADDRFSFGSGAADVVCEVSGYGWYLTKKARAFRSQHYLGIPVTKLFTYSKKLDNSEWRITSVGRSIKYKPTNQYNFPKLAANLLGRIKCKITLIGTDGSEEWWQQVRRQHPESLEFIQSVPHDELIRYLIRSDCYVDSFPLIGGTAFPEIALTGIPAFGVRASPIGYSVADSIRYNSVNEMENGIVNYLLTGQLDYDKKCLMDAISENNSLSSIEERLNDLDDCVYRNPPADINTEDVRSSVASYGDRWMNEQVVHLRLVKSTFRDGGIEYRLVAKYLLLEGLKGQTLVRAVKMLINNTKLEKIIKLLRNIRWMRWWPAR